METLPIIYRDLDLSLAAHPLTADLQPLSNVAALRRALYNLIRRNNWSIPFNPKSGNYLSESLFDNIDALTALDIKDRLEWLISTHEPRCKVNSINVDSDQDDNSFNITIDFSIDSLAVSDILSISLNSPTQ